MTAVNLAILFFAGQLNHRNGSAEINMNTVKSLSLREIADTTEHVSAPPATHPADREAELIEGLKPACDPVAHSRFPKFW